MRVRWLCEKCGTAFAMKEDAQKASEEEFEVRFNKRNGWWHSERTAMFVPGATGHSNEFRTLFEAATWTAADIMHDIEDRDFPGAVKEEV